MPGLSGEKILVTGPASQLGLPVARALAANTNGGSSRGELPARAAARQLPVRRYRRLPERSQPA